MGAVSFWRPTRDESGPTRLGVWMLRLHLGWLARPFGIGMHSDAQLTSWACDRELRAKRAFQDAVYELQRRDLEAALQVRRRWEGL